MIQVKMSLQLYQVDQKNYLLDFKSLDIADHPDAARVKRMTKASMTGSGDEPSGQTCHSSLLPGMGSLIVGGPVFRVPVLRYVVVKTLIEKTAHYPRQK